MRPICSVLIGMLILLACTRLRAQQPNPTPTLNIEMKQVALEDLFREIERQTGVFFSYESSLLKDMPKVSFSASNEMLSYCLRRLFANLPITYRITGHNIILKRSARQFTISGFVRDSISYESLLGAHLWEANSKQGASTNNYGFYSISLPEGKVTLRASYVGYESKEHTFTLSNDTLVEISLLPAGKLNEVVVEGINPLFQITNVRPGFTDVPVQTVKSMPALLGEPDLIKTLQQLPGVAQGMEGMTGLYVRGGNGDENLFLLDGNPVYHVNHVGGFFSAFNPDALKTTTFYKGAFPAQYGGRASSVVDVRMRDGDRQQYHGNLSIGLISAKLNFEGPIVPGRSSFNISARRSWSEFITAPIMAVGNKGKEDKEIGGFHFYDINAKVNHSFNDRSQLYLNFYTGDDSYKSGRKYRNFKEQDVFHWKWGNLIGSANWSYIMNEKMFANFTAGYTRYRSRIDQIDNSFMPPVEGRPLQISHQATEYHSNIQDISFRADFDYRPHQRHRIKMGTDYLLHLFRPEYNSLKYWYKDSVVTQNTDTVYLDRQIRGHELSFYLEDEMSLSDRLTVNAGLRHTLFMVDGTSYHSFQPRFSVRYLIQRDLSVKASYAKMNQYIHQLSNSYINLPTDLWVPVTDKIRPIQSHHFSAGAYYNLNKEYDFSLEGYYKRTSNLIEYDDNLSAITSYAGWDERVSVGKGVSYGMELMARRSVGKTTGWLAYTLSWTKRQFPGSQINRGKWYPDKFDNRHKLSFAITHRLSAKTELSAAWVIASGNRITVMTDQYLSPTYPAGHGFFESDKGKYQYSSNSRNNYRLSPYHRLDLGMNLYLPTKKGNMSILNFSLYNATMTKNPFMVECNYYPDGDTYRVTLKKTTLFMMLPSVSYTYKF